MDNFSGENYNIWKSTPWKKDQFKGLSPKEQLQHFCLVGHLAPNTHNTQPWRFEINLEEMEIMMFINIHFILPASDINGRQTVISSGCALKNIEVSSRYFGYKTEIKILNSSKEDFKPGIPDPELIALAKIKFISDTPDDSLEKNYLAIFNRQVTRAEYNEQTPIPIEILEKIESINNEKIEIHLVSDRWRRLTIGEFQGQADNFVINSKKFSHELGEWLLPNDTESFVGMPGVGFGLADDEAQRLHSGLKGETALRPEDGLKFSMGGKIGIEKSPTVCFLTSQEDTIESWLEAGKVMEEIFLQLTAEGIYCAVHAGIAEVTLINKLFSMSFLGTTSRIMTLFRMGYLKRDEDKKRPHSPRWPLSKVIINY